MSDSQRNSIGSMDTHTQSTIADNYSDSFESEPDPEQNLEIKQTPYRKVKKNTTQSRKKQSIHTKLMRITPTYEMEQKIVTAKKLNNNELRNLNAELLRQIEKQKEEIRILKRMEFRQSKALEKFENSKSRLPMLLESHNKEMLGMREQIRTMKTRYRKSQESLREVEDELKKNKNRLNKYKALVDDENLQERAELSKQLNIAQQKVKELETKIQELEIHIQHLIKNHKYEVNIEKAQSKKIKFSIQELEEKYNRLEIQLLEKEKELEVWNIYSNRQRNITQKMSSSRSTPSVKSKFNERVPPLTPPPVRMKRYEERRRHSKKQKESMLKKVNSPSPRAASDTKSNQPSVIDDIDFNPSIQTLNETVEPIEPASVMDTHKFTCQESIQEEVVEMLENIKLDKTKMKTFPDANMKPEKTVVKQEKEEKYQMEDLRQHEIERIEENAKKEREQLQKDQEEERKKKDLLLARLRDLDNKTQTLINSENDLATDTPSKTGYTFTKQTENLHQGRPSNDLDFWDSPLKFSQIKQNSLLKQNQSTVGTSSQKGSRVSSRKPDNMIEDFFTSTVSPQNTDGLKMSSFVNGDVPIHHDSKRSKKLNKMESSVYKELFGENVDDSISSNRNSDLILGDLNQPSRQDSVWINQTVGNVGGLFSGDGLNNSYNDGGKLLPSRQQVSIFETRSTINAIDNSSDSIEEIIL